MAFSRIVVLCALLLSSSASATGELEAFQSFRRHAAALFSANPESFQTDTPEAERLSSKLALAVKNIAIHGAVRAQYLRLFEEFAESWHAPRLQDVIASAIKDPNHDVAIAAMQAAVVIRHSSRQENPRILDAVLGLVADELTDPALRSVAYETLEALFPFSEYGAQEIKQVVSRFAHEPAAIALRLMLAEAGYGGDIAMLKKLARGAERCELALAEWRQR